MLKPQLSQGTRPQIELLGGKLRGLVAGGSLPVADQAMISLVNFLMNALLARALGATQFGVFALAWLVVLIVCSLQFALISAPMLSIGPKQAERDAPAYFAAVFAQQAIFVALTLVLVWAFAVAGAWLVPAWGTADVALPLAMAAGAYQVQDFVRRYFFACGRAPAALVLDGVSYLGKLALLSMLLWTDAATPAMALWVIAASSALAAAFGALRLGPLSWQPAHFRHVVRRHWLSARWLGADAVALSISAYVFVFACGAMLGPAAAGVLRAAQNLMGVTNVIFLALENFVPTRAATVYHRLGLGAMNRYVGTVLLVGSAVTALVVTALAVKAEFWLGLAYGAEYEPYGWLLRWYAAVFMLRFVHLPLKAGLRALEVTRPIFLATAFGAFIAMASVYPLITWLGLSGAVLGALVVQTVKSWLLVTSFLRLARRRVVLEGA